MKLTRLLLGFLLGFAFGLSTLSLRGFREYGPGSEGMGGIPKVDFARERARHPKVGKGRVLCWILTLQVTKRDRLFPHQSWAQSCDKLVYVAKEKGLAYDPRDTFVHGYELMDKFDLWNQIHRGWTIITEHFLNDFEWFIKLDTDSYFIGENFHYVTNLKKWSPEDLVYFGNTIFEQSRRINEKRAQFNLGAGYGVSQAMLRAVYPYFPLANSSIPKEKRCPPLSRWNEDVKFRDCLAFAVPDIMPVDTRDEYQREFFLPFTPEIHFEERFLPWYYRGKEHLLPIQRSTRCASTRPVLWHALKTAKEFWQVDYFMYDIAVDPKPPSPLYE